jgi:hypothetical protein
MTREKAQDAWIDLLERDLGQPAVLRLLANCGGQKRAVPKRAEGSALARELGPEVAEWLALRFGGTSLDIPSPRGREQQSQASRLRAAILDAGLTEPRRSANDIASEFGVSAVWVHTLRSRMRAEFAQLSLPLPDPAPRKPPYGA